MGTRAAENWVLVRSCCLMLSEHPIYSHLISSTCQYNIYVVWHARACVCFLGVLPFWGQAMLIIFSFADHGGGWGLWLCYLELQCSMSHERNTNHLSSYFRPEVCLPLLGWRAARYISQFCEWASENPFVILSDGNCSVGLLGPEVLLG